MCDMCVVLCCYCPSIDSLQASNMTWSAAMDGEQACQLGVVVVAATTLTKFISCQIKQTKPLTLVAQRRKKKIGGNLMEYKQYKQIHTKKVIYINQKLLIMPSSSMSSFTNALRDTVAG